MGINEGPLCGDQFEMFNLKSSILPQTIIIKLQHWIIIIIIIIIINYYLQQIIPLMRRACHNAITNAIPKLMEPIYQLNVICSYKAINVIKHLLLNKTHNNNNNNDVVKLIL